MNNKLPSYKIGCITRVKSESVTGHGMTLFAEAVTAGSGKPPRGMIIKMPIRFCSSLLFLYLSFSLGFLAPRTENVHYK